MSYASGGLIQATDFNGIANGTTGANVAWVWGVGYGSVGYGQGTTALASLSSSTQVTAAQWSGMLSALNGALGHQSGSGAQLGPLNYTTGQTITYFSNVLTAATTINTNAALYTAQGTTQTGSTFSPNPSVASGSAYNNADMAVRTVTFNSGANAARYFFNAGGQINFVTISTTNGGTGGTSQSTDVVSILNAIGTYQMKNTQYRTLATSLATVQGNDTGSGSYTADYANLRAQTNAVNSAAAGDYGSVITFRVGLNTTAHSAFNAGFNVTYNHRVDVIFPETTYLTTNSWGTVTIA